jgi:hypothetical protein
MRVMGILPVCVTGARLLFVAVMLPSGDGRTGLARRSDRLNFGADGRWESSWRPWAPA